MQHPTSTQQSSSTIHQTSQGLNSSGQDLVNTTPESLTSPELSSNLTKDKLPLMSVDDMTKRVFMILLVGTLLLIQTPLGLFVMIFITLPSWMLKLETKTDIMMTSPATGLGWLLGMGLLAFVLGLVSWFLAAIWHGLQEAKLQEQQRARLRK